MEEVGEKKKEEGEGEGREGSVGGGGTRQNIFLELKSFPTSPPFEKFVEKVS